MTVCTDYSMGVDDALLIAGISQYDLETRRDMVGAVLATEGAGRLVEMLAQLIGMANSVAENSKEMTDFVLISEYGAHPERVGSINLPSIIGACQGVQLAAKCDPAGACHGCAYRLGSVANQSPIATSDAEYVAENARGFGCHAETDAHGNATKVCVGHAKAATALRDESVTAPAKRTFEVWIEGYSVTGNSSKAQSYGEFEGATFSEAVEQFLETLSDEDRSYFHKSDDGQWRSWGCRLFDNEKDARKAFG